MSDLEYKFPSLLTNYSNPTESLRGLTRALEIMSSEIVKAVNTKQDKHYRRVLVFPPSTVVGSNVLKPDGTWVDVTGTTTAGLQEAIDVMAAVEGWDLEIIGGEEPITRGAIVYNVSDTLSFPPMQGKSIKIGAATINCNNSIGAGAGIQFDTCLMVDFDISGGQIVYGTTNTAFNVLFQPTNPAPLDTWVTGIADSTFKFGAIATNPTVAGTASVRFNNTIGGMGSNYFEFQEINGGYEGISIVGMTSTTAFQNNFIKCPHVHGFGDAALQLGSDAASKYAYGNDIHIVTQRDAAQTPTRRLDIWGYNNTIRAQLYSDSDAVSNVVWESTSYGNLLITNSIDMNKIINSATIKTNRIIYPRVKLYGAIDVGASPNIYQNVSSFNEVVIVSGGTVSNIDYSTDNVTFYDAGATSGSFPLPIGTYLRVTYTAAPTMYRIY